MSVFFSMSCPSSTSLWQRLRVSAIGTCEPKHILGSFKSPGNNCWSHATALITESRLCIQSRGKFLVDSGAAGEILDRKTVFHVIFLFFSISTDLWSCTNPPVTVATARFNGDNAWLSQSFIAACRCGFSQALQWRNQDNHLFGICFWSCFCYVLDCFFFFGFQDFGCFWPMLPILLQSCSFCIIVDHGFRALRDKDMSPEDISSNHPCFS